MINHNPVALVDDIAEQPAVGIAARACLHTLRALSISAMTNAAAATYKGVVAPAIIAGTLAGCGGKLLSDSLESVSGGRGKFELNHPGFLLRSSVVNSSLFYILVHYLKALSSVEATGLLLVISLAYTLSDDLTGNVVDASVHITNVFCTVISPKKLLGGRSAPKASAAAASPARARSTSRKRAKVRTYYAFDVSSIHSPYAHLEVRHSRRRPRPGVELMPASGAPVPDRNDRRQLTNSRQIYRRSRRHKTQD